MRALLISRGFPRATTFAIYNGLDFSRSVTAARRAAFYARVGANVGPGDVVVGAAARLDPVKDLSTLVRGFALAKKSVPGLKLIIAGEGAERPVLESLARELGVEGKHYARRLAGRHGRILRLAGHQRPQQHIGDLPYAITEGAAHRCPPSPAAWAASPASSRTASPAISSSPATGRRWASAWRAWPPTPLCARPWARAIFERAARDFSMEATCREQRAVYEEILSREANGGRAGVLICGAYGMGNAGDEAILDAITAEMRSIDPLMPITVLSRDPEGAEARLDVDAIHTFNVPASCAPCAAARCT